MSAPLDHFLSHRFVLSVAALGLALAIGLASPAAADPVVTLYPTHGRDGTDVHISACGFAPNLRGQYTLEIDGIDYISDRDTNDCADGTIGFGTGGLPTVLAIHGRPGPHRVRVLLHPRGVPTPWASADATFTIDLPLKVRGDLPVIPIVMVTPTPTPTPPIKAIISPNATNLNPNIANTILNNFIQLTVHIDSVDPNPGLPNSTEVVHFTVGNNTNSDANVEIDGLVAGQHLGGHDRTATIPAHGHSSLTLGTLYHVPAGNLTATVHVVLPGPSHLAPGPNGTVRSITTPAAEASDSMSFSVKDACAPRSRTATTMQTLIVIFEKLNGDPHLPGLTWQPLFTRANHLDLSSVVSPPEAWERTLISRIWLDLKNGDGNTTTAVQGNAIHLHQEYDVHLDSIGMVWGMTADLDALPALGGAWTATPQNFHLALQVPDGDEAGLVLLTGGAWLAGKPTLERYLQGVAASYVGTPVANGIAAELGLPGFFPSMDDDGRPRTGFSMSAPNMTTNYCFQGV